MDAYMSNGQVYVVMDEVEAESLIEDLYDADSVMFDMLYAKLVQAV